MATYTRQAWTIDLFAGNEDNQVSDVLPDYQGIPGPDWYTPAGNGLLFDGAGGCYNADALDLTSQLSRVYTPVVTTANQFAQARVRKWSAPGSPSYAGVTVRNDLVATKQYALLYDSSLDGWRLVKQVGATTTTLASYSGAGQGIAIGASGSCILIVQGTTLTAITNGVEHTPITDTTTAAAGRMGLCLLPHAGDDSTHGLHVEAYLGAYLPA